MAANDVRPSPSRRCRYQFRLRTLLALVCLACVVFAWPQIRRQYAFWQLKRFIGRNFEDLPDNQRAFAESLVGRITEPWTLRTQRPRRLLGGFHTWKVLRRSPNDRQQQFCVIQIQQAISIPGVSRARVYHLDGIGNVTGKIEFDAGYRSFVDKVEFDEGSRGFPCLILETHHTHCGKTRQFYLMAADRMELIRSETLGGELYTHAGNSFDPYDTPVPPETWRKLLNSDATVDRLRGLGHMWSWDVPARIDLDNELRLDLQRLTSSQDSWISESACIALDQFSDRAARLRESRRSQQ